MREIEFTHVMPIEQAESIAKRSRESLTIRVKEDVGLRILERLAAERDLGNGSVPIKVDDRVWRVLKGTQVRDETEVELVCVPDLVSEVVFPQ